MKPSPPCWTGPRDYFRVEADEYAGNAPSPALFKHPHVWRCLKASCSRQNICRRSLEATDTNRGCIEQRSRWVCPLVLCVLCHLTSCRYPPAPHWDSPNECGKVTLEVWFENCPVDIFVSYRVSMDIIWSNTINSNTIKHCFNRSPTSNKGFKATQ